MRTTDQLDYLKAQRAQTLREMTAAKNAGDWDAYVDLEIDYDFLNEDIKRLSAKEQS